MDRSLLLVMAAVLVAIGSAAAPAGKLKCENPLSCNYSPREFGPDSIQNFRRDMMICAFKKPNYYLNEDEIVTPTSDQNSLFFEFTDKDKMDKFQKCLERVDIKPISAISEESNIEVLVQVYALDSIANEGFQAGLNMRYSPENKITENLASRISGAIKDTGLYGMSFSGGNLMSTLLQLTLDFGRASSWSALVEHYPIAAQSRKPESLSFSKNVFFEKSIGSINQTSSMAGLNISMTPILLNDGRIQLKDLSFYFASETGEKTSLTESIQKNSGAVTLNNGEAFLIAGKQFQAIKDEKSNALIFSQHSKKGSILANTYVMITAFQKKKSENLTNHRQLTACNKIYNEELSSYGDSQSVANILNSVTAGVDHVIGAPFGQRVWLKFDEALLDRSNNNQSLELEIYDSLSSQPIEKKVLSTNCFAKGKVYLQGIKLEDFCRKSENKCESIRYFVNIKSLRGNNDSISFSLSHEPRNHEVFLEKTQNRYQPIKKQTFFSQIFESGQ